MPGKSPVNTRTVRVSRLRNSPYVNAAMDRLWSMGCQKNHPSLTGRAMKVISHVPSRNTYICDG